jgi:hypothetical protein
MNKNEQAARVKAVRAYLENIGAPVTSVQGYEVLARSHGLKSKHVLVTLADDAQRGTTTSPPSKFVEKFVEMDGKSVPVMALTDEPFSVPRMRELDWSFDIVIPVALDQLDDIDVMNDYASTRITGSEAALEDIRFDHVPEVVYGKGWVAYRVTGYVSSPDDIFTEDKHAQEAQFYADLAEFADRLRGNTVVNLARAGSAVEVVLRRIDAQACTLLRRYARSQGSNNDSVNRRGAELVFEATLNKRGANEVVFAARLFDLKYARKLGTDVFAFDFEGTQVTMQFLL